MKNHYRFVSLGLVLLLCSLSFGVKGSDDTLVQPKIDLVFVIDTTGSMSDEIREVKMHIKNVIEEVLAGTPRPDVAIGFVVYRDYPDQEDEYVYTIYPMTTDIDTVLADLEGFIAAGGGDEEETVTIGLDVAINEMNWRVSGDNGTDGEIIGYDPNQNPIYASSGPIRRMMFLIGDAPPRTREYQGPEDIVRPLPAYKQNIEDAQEKNITIYTISCSGMNDEGIAIWQKIASETKGKYERLTYERKNIQDYVAEEKLDDHWVDTVKNMSDYEASSDSIMTNSLGDFVRSSILSEAKSLGVRYEDELLDGHHVIYITDMGYLIDEDNDTVYDIFHDNGTGKNTTVTLKDSTYLLDVDDDGTWEYTYNSAEGLVPYQEKIAGFEFVGILLLFIIGVVIGVVLLLKRK